jgi:hypothetical protein
MSSRRVRANCRYVYDPALLDRFDARTTLKKGDVVPVVNLPGCPKANALGHCHVADLNGKFIGLVCCGSLVPVRSKRAQEILTELKTELPTVSKGENDVEPAGYQPNEF